MKESKSMFLRSSYAELVSSCSTSIVNENKFFFRSKKFPMWCSIRKNFHQGKFHGQRIESNFIPENVLSRERKNKDYSNNKNFEEFLYTIFPQLLQESIINVGIFFLHWNSHSWECTIDSLYWNFFEEWKFCSLLRLKNLSWWT